MSNGEVILMPPQWDLDAADEFIRFNWLDTDDWFAADTTRKTTLCNVAWRVLTRKFLEYEIPNEAVYLFAAVLASARNNVFKAAQGVESIDVGDTRVVLKETSKTELDDLIPRMVYDLIGVPYKPRVFWTVL